MAAKRPASSGRTSEVRETPKRRTCAVMQHHFAMLDQFPEGRVNGAMIEAHTRVCMNCGDSAFRTGITTIPVVVHVVHRTTDENINDAQIKSQIAVLNKDFRGKNADKSKIPGPFKPLFADARIEFKLAEVDPQGRQTSGITRTSTNVVQFAPDDSVKFASSGGADAWDAAKYLNIWVCSLGDNLLGYAQFPGMPPQTDGVVILNTAFGTSGTASPPFDKGRTTTHEIGHYLNLFHIWGNSLFATCGDDDGVGDTPKQFQPNTGKPMFPSISCGNGPDGDMFMNYMDYTDDDSMFMFTQEQVARMQATLTGPRKDLGV